MRRLAAPVLAALALLVLVPAAALAGSRFYVRGAGYGHGVGMSQYGAYGYALHGKDFRWILRHYYQGTDLSRTGTGTGVRVLLQQAGAVAFSGADHAGEKALDPARRYVSRASAPGEVSVEDDSGREVARLPAPLRVSGAGALRLGGRALNGVSSGRYRGALVLSPRGSGLAAVNVLGIDDYVRGVVGGEMPSSWAAEALRVQAVAARSYALSSGAGRELYPDTRSQVYQGVAAEVPSTDAAVRATRGLVVTYRGALVTTFFFSTSGGRTENVENSFLGSTPEPYLRSVVDQYDSLSSLHRWGPYGMSLDAAGAKLRGLVRGSFRGIRVTRRGRSPRIVSALVLGSRGNTRVSGPTLRQRFGLYDTWAYFTTVSAGARPPSSPPTSGGSSSTGGARASTATASALARAVNLVTTTLSTPPARTQVLGGAISPAPRRGRVAVQRREGRGWRRVSTLRLGRGGTYRVRERAPGRYRVVYARMASPEVELGG